jgi:Ca2+-binding RTX toxin-like protein
MGDDTIYGNRGNGRIRGGEGDDLIFGESGNDKLFGGPDDDSLTGGPGIDTFNCGDGDDAVTDYNPAKNETMSANCENIINVTDDIAINIPTNIAEQTADNISISPFNLSLLEEEDEDDDVGVEKEEEEEIVTEG